MLETFERDMQIINELGVELLYAIETHAHADHITSAGKIREIPAPSWSTVKARVSGDRRALGTAKALPRALPDPAISTPGHTNGCTCYFSDGMLFSGDTLLIRGCGRTDFQSATRHALRQHHAKAVRAGDDTIVYPAHDYNGRTSSTIGEEKAWNPRLGAGARVIPSSS